MSKPQSRVKDSAFPLAEAPSSVREVALPDVVDGRYRVLGRVGSGGMGVVLRAEDLFLQRAVAIKIIDETSDPKAGERFIKEAQALAQVRHENVVQVYAFGPLQRSSYLAMELVSGETLDKWIDRHSRAGETIPLDRGMTLLRAVARGLDAVHARQLVHRDVKPGNIIIEQETDRPVLIDFGLARRRSKSNPRFSITGGTPSYMAPEQLRDRDGTRVSARTDLYAFACTAFEVFTGCTVFECRDIYSAMTAHLTEAPRRISSLKPELASFDAALERALSKDQGDRQGSLAELMGELDECYARLTEEKPSARVSPSFVGIRALVLASDTSLRRSLVRNTAHTFRTHGEASQCDGAESLTEVADLLSRNSYDVIVVDEESVGDRLRELVRFAYQKAAETEFVVVSRDLPATTRALGEVRIRHLVPKPVNVHVLAAVLGRLSLLKRR
jgi:serine/threonine-protein kinase